MKFFSIINIIVTTTIIGYLFIIGLPKIASVGELTNTKLPKEMHIPKKPTELIDNMPSEQNLQIIDACNTAAESRTFTTGEEADTFLENCKKDKQNNNVSVAPDSANTVIEDTNTVIDTNTSVPGKIDLQKKCADFMTRARFESQAAADTFLKNCLESQ